MLVSASEAMAEVCFRLLLRSPFTCSISPFAFDTDQQWQQGDDYQRKHHVVLHRHYDAASERAATRSWRPSTGPPTFDTFSQSVPRL